MQKYKVKNSEIIRRYGDEALRSEEFKKATKQIHHKYTTVANHTLFVTDTAIYIGRFLKKTHLCRIDEKVLVQSCLCHDFGILGREERFDSDSLCYKYHPDYSVLVTKRLYPNANHKTLNAVKYHMFPVTRRLPESPEGFVLIMADKICSVSERLYLEAHKEKRA